VAKIRVNTHPIKVFWIKFFMRKSFRMTRFVKIFKYSKIWDSDSSAVFVHSKMTLPLSISKKFLKINPNILTFLYYINNFLLFFK
jgi:hypothetical protein